MTSLTNIARGEGRHELAGAVLVVSIVGLLGLIFTGTLHSITSGEGGRTVRAEFADAGQVAAGDPVRIAGVKVGTVSGVRPMKGRVGAVVDMDLHDDAGALYADAKAALRYKTLLGGAFSVVLDRGTPVAGSLPDDRIPLRQTSGQVEVADLLDMVRDGARRGLQTLPREVSDSMSNPNTLRDSLATLHDVAPGLALGASAVRGRLAGYDLPSVVRSGAKTVAALDVRNDALQRLVAGSARTLATTAARAADLKTTIRRLPPSLRETRSTLRALNHTLRVADPVLEKLARVAHRVAPAVRDLRPVLLRADVLLRRATPLLTQLRPAAASLGRTAQNGLPLLRTLLPSLDRLDDVLLPALAEKDPVTEKSTAVMIGGWAAGLGSGAAGASDANGHFIRFPATAGSSSAYLPCQTHLNNPDHEQQIECQSLSDAVKTLLGAPGGGASRKAGRR